MMCDDIKIHAQLFKQIKEIKLNYFWCYLIQLWKNNHLVVQYLQSKDGV